MTTQEIVDQVRSLPLAQQREVLHTLAQSVDKIELSEAEIAEKLLANGVIKEIPSAWNAPDDNFEPITIKGKPLSETILEDRN